MAGKHSLPQETRSVRSRSLLVVLRFRLPRAALTLAGALLFPPAALAAATQVVLPCCLVRARLLVLCVLPRQMHRAWVVLVAWQPWWPGSLKLDQAARLGSVAAVPVVPLAPRAAV